MQRDSLTLEMNAVLISVLLLVDSGAAITAVLSAWSPLNRVVDTSVAGTGSLSSFQSVVYGVVLRVSYCVCVCWPALRISVLRRSESPGVQVGV